MAPMAQAQLLGGVVAVAAVSGLYTAIWGAFKDAPYEGFRSRSFPRSVATSVVVALLLLGIAPLRQQVFALSLFHLFLLIMGIERILNEIYKACFRARRDDPARFQIPQRLSFFGRQVHSELVRTGLGVLGLGAAVAVLLIPARVTGVAGFIGVAFGTGTLIGILGAHKDAPFEGFQWDKFFRSAIVLTLASPLIYALGPAPLGLLIFVNGGLERMLMEFDKSYVQQSVPGKFRSDLAPCDPRFVLRRPWLHRAAMLIIAGVAMLYVHDGLARRGLGLLA